MVKHACTILIGLLSLPGVMAFPIGGSLVLTIPIIQQHLSFICDGIAAVQCDVLLAPFCCLDGDKEFRSVEMLDFCRDNKIVIQPVIAYNPTYCHVSCGVIRRCKS